MWSPVAVRQLVYCCGATFCKPSECKPRGLQDPRLEVLPCMHSGTYADDCICERIQQHKCYIVATCDRDLRRRIRKANLAWVYALICMLPSGFCGHGGVKRRPGAEGFV
jgi:Fcf1